MNTYDLTQVNKIHLLRELWDNSKPAIFFEINGLTPPAFDYYEAKPAVETNIDYFCGRCIKLDFGRNVLTQQDVSSYDRDLGKGTFERCYEKVKAST